MIYYAGLHLTYKIVVRQMFWTPVPSGVPQGSILGHLLFITFIGDIGSCFIHSDILLFADDMKVLNVIREQAGVNDLQADVSRFQAYCTMSRLELNVFKCF